MPGDLRSGGWQDLNDDSSEGVSSDHAYRGVIMEPMKAVRTLLGRCQVNG